MADETTDAVPEGDDEYLTERTRRHQRFLELGGSETIFQRLREYRRSPVLSEYVTDVHRDLVLDLRTAGLTHEGIAIMLGISKDTCQRLFKFELDAGKDIGIAAASMPLLQNAMAGDTAAALGYLKNHPELRWGTKSEITGKDGKDLHPEANEQLAANQAWMAKTLTELMTDKKHKRAPTKVSVPKAQDERQTPKKGVQSKPLKRPKQET